MSERYLKYIRGGFLDQIVDAVLGQSVVGHLHPDDDVGNVLSQLLASADHILRFKESEEATSVARTLRPLLSVAALADVQRRSDLKVGASRWVGRSSILGEVGPNYDSPQFIGAIGDDHGLTVGVNIIEVTPDGHGVNIRGGVVDKPRN